LICFVYAINVFVWRGTSKFYKLVPNPIVYIYIDNKIIIK
jgi:hypothetical protein